MSIDPNHDIVPTLRMFDGVMMGLAADEIEALRARVIAAEELLRSAHAIALRKGESTAWERFAASVAKIGVGSVTPRTYRILPSDEQSVAPAAGAEPSDMLLVPRELIVNAESMIAEEWGEDTETGRALNAILHGNPA